MSGWALAALVGADFLATIFFATAFLVATGSPKMSVLCCCCVSSGTAKLLRCCSLAASLLPCTFLRCAFVGCRLLLVFKLLFALDGGLDLVAKLLEPLDLGLNLLNVLGGLTRRQTMLPTARY